MNQRLQTRECSLEQLQPDVLKAIRHYYNSIIPSNLVSCFETQGIWEYAGLLGKGSKTVYDTYIITADRVISIPPSIDSESKRVYYFVDSQNMVEFVDIESIEQTQHPSGVYDIRLKSRLDQAALLQKNAAPELHLIVESSQIAMRLVSIIKTAVEQIRGSTQVTSFFSPNSVEERIRALKQLRQDGLITEAQFQQKIQEIVNQL